MAFSAGLGSRRWRYGDGCGCVGHVSSSLELCRPRRQMAGFARVVDLVAGRREEHSRGVQQFADREDDHQQRDQPQVQVESGVGRQRIDLEHHQAEEEGLHGDDVGVHDELHQQAGKGDAEQQGQHQVIGRGRDVADALDQETPGPEPGQAGGHGEAGIHAEGLDEGDDEIHRFGEVAQVAQQHQRQPDVEQPAQRPDPQVGLEQAFKKHHFAEHAEGHAACGGWRRRGRNLQRRRRAGVVIDPVRDTAHENQRGGIEQQREQKIHRSGRSRARCGGQAGLSRAKRGAGGHKENLIGA